MPVLKHAKKKLRQDKKRTVANKKVKDSYKSLIKAAKKAKTPAALIKAFQAIDKAAKQNIMHVNKAARLKSSLSKLVAVKSEKKQVTSETKTVVTKKTPKAKAAKTPAKTPKKSSK